MISCRRLTRINPLQRLALQTTGLADVRVVHLLRHVDFVESTSRTQILEHSRSNNEVRRFSIGRRRFYLHTVISKCQQCDWYL